MKNRLFSLLLCTLLIGAFVSLAAAQSVDLRLRDGTRWRGAVGDNVQMVVLENRARVEYSGEIVATGTGWLQLRTQIMGEMRTRTIAHGDIVSIEKAEPPAEVEGTAPRGGAGRGAPRPAERTGRGTAGDTDTPGVFLLPLVGEVGMKVRHNEIKAIIEEADRYGRGQIIILDIDSPGGSVLEEQKIIETIFEGKERHRIIAWVRRAISAAAAAACACDEIYFATEGTLGAMTMLMGGGASVGQEMQERNARYAGEWFARAGRDAIIAHAMILADRELSYDKDEHGRVTWHPNLSGEYIVSRKGQNLVFDSRSAVHSRFAQGLADTKEDLARLLDLPEWREVNDMGRRLHESWMRTIEQAEEEIRLAQFRYGNPVGRDDVERLSYQKRQLEEILRWRERLGYPADQLENLRRMIRELEKQISDLRRRR